jgi:tubulin-specific chaperone A
VALKVANKLGKIKFLFEETKDLNVEQSYNSIGSAINELGQNGSHLRLISLISPPWFLTTDVLKPSIQTLALGAAFEESNRV